MLPKVNITVANGQLGRTLQTQDGICGLILSSGVTGLYGKPKVVYNLKDAETLGITSTGDRFAWGQIADFYREAGDGAKLWVMCYAETVTNTEVLNPAGTNTARPLIESAQGEISLLGIARKVTSEASVSGNFIKADVIGAIAGSKTFIDSFRTSYRPFRVILGGRMNDASATPQDLHTYTNNNVAVVLGGENADNDFQAVGLALGKLSRIPVHQNIGRVKDGALSLTEAYLKNPGNPEILIDDIGSVIDDCITKGYICMRRYIGRSGYYWSDDPMAVAETDDYAIMTNGRVIDKALRIAYQVYLNELNESVQVDANGYISPALAKYFEGVLENQIRTIMAGEISSFDAFVDPEQNIVATNELNIVASIVPVGYSKIINITLGFSNPFNN